MAREDLQRDPNRFPRVAGSDVSWHRALTENIGIKVIAFLLAAALYVHVVTDRQVEQVISLPVEIIAEYDTWRRIRDREGAVGWVHQSTLSGRRSVIVSARTRTLRRKPTAKAPPVALAEAGVIAGLLECADEWCRIDAQGYRGWLKRDEVWGVYAGEKLD